MRGRDDKTVQQNLRQATRLNLVWKELTTVGSSQTHTQTVNTDEVLSCTWMCEGFHEIDRCILEPTERTCIRMKCHSCTAMSLARFSPALKEAQEKLEQKTAQTL